MCVCVQLCLALGNPVDYSLPGSSVHGIFQARILKWFAIPFSSGPCFVELSTMTRPSWVALYGMTHSFFELNKAVVHVSSLVSFL